MYKIILFIFISISLFADQGVVLNSKNIKLTDFEMSYYDDKVDLSYEEIKNKKFTPSSNKISRGVNNRFTWAKITITNKTLDIQKLFILHPVAHHYRNICVYEEQNGELIKSIEIDIEESNHKYIYGGNVIYELSLKPKETKTVYMKIGMFSYHWFTIMIYDEFNLKKVLTSSHVDMAFLVASLLTLAIYNFLLYFTSFRKENLYYSFYLFFASIWIALAYGLMAVVFDIYGITYFRLNYSLIIMPIFLILFLMEIFNTKKRYKKEHLFLKSAIFLIATNMIYGLYDFDTALKLASLLAVYVMIVTTFAAISFYKKKNPLAKYFILGHLFFIIFNILAVLYYRGLIENNYITSHGVGIGIAIEAIMLSFIISYRIKLLEKKDREFKKTLKSKVKEKTDELLTQRSKMENMGEMIGNIAHQWRQPLAIVGTSVGILKEKKLIGQLSDDEFNEELEYIELNTLHMSQTIDDFLTYFAPNKIKEKFNVLKSVDKAILITDNMLSRNNITTLIDVDENYMLHGYKEEYVQVIISIITNSIHALETKDKKILTIKSNYKDNQFVLEIDDTGGGITDDIIQRIFEPYFTTRHSSQGTGLGLYIAKMIIENSMHGKLGVSNTKEGAKFSIKIKETDEKSVNTDS